MTVPKSNFCIEKNVPLPPARACTKYPFGDMEVGDSFLVACTDDQRRAVLTRVGVAANSHRRRHGRRYSSRTVSGGIRVWRIE